MSAIAFAELRGLCDEEYNMSWHAFVFAVASAF